MPNHTLARGFAWNTADEEEIRLTTIDLIRIFGIPDGKHIEFEGITYSSSVGSASIVMSVDSGRQTTLDPEEGFEEGAKGRVELTGQGVANRQSHMPLFGLACFDELIFKDASGSGSGWTINMLFKYASGAMQILDDLAINVGDIRQIIYDPDAGTPFHQIPLIRQVEG